MTNNQKAIATLFQAELAAIYARFGEEATVGVIASIDTALGSMTKGLSGDATYEIPRGWPDWNGIEAQLIGQKAGAAVAATAGPDLITMTADDLAKLIAAARTEPGTEITDIEYDHYGTDGKPTRITRRRGR